MAWAGRGRGGEFWDLEYALRPKGGFRRDFNFFGRVFRWSAWSFSFPFISQVPISGQTLFTGEGSFTTFAELSFKTRFPFCACVADVSVSTRSTLSALRLTLSVVHATQALQKLSQSEADLGKQMTYTSPRLGRLFHFGAHLSDSECHTSVHGVVPVFGFFFLRAFDVWRCLG